MNVFDHELLEGQLERIKNQPPFKPEPYEPRFTITQLFETGIEAKVSYVIRNGEKLFYECKQYKIKDESTRR